MRSFFQKTICKYRNKYVPLPKKQIKMKTVNYTDLRNNLNIHLDNVVNDCEPLIVYRSVGTSVVVMSLDEYNAIEETEYLTSSPAMMKRLRSAENNMNEGKGRKINIADL